MDRICPSWAPTRHVDVPRPPPRLQARSPRGSGHWEDHGVRSRGNPAYIARPPWPPLRGLWRFIRAFVCAAILIYFVLSGIYVGAASFVCLMIGVLVLERRRRYGAVRTEIATSRCHSLLTRGLLGPPLARIALQRGRVVNDRVELAHRPASERAERSWTNGALPPQVERPGQCRSPRRAEQPPFGCLRPKRERAAPRNRPKLGTIGGAAAASRLANEGRANGPVVESRIDAQLDVPGRVVDKHSKIDVCILLQWLAPAREPNGQMA